MQLATPRLLLTGSSCRDTEALRARASYPYFHADVTFYSSQSLVHTRGMEMKLIWQQKTTKVDSKQEASGRRQSARESTTITEFTGQIFMFQGELIPLTLTQLSAYTFA